MKMPVLKQPMQICGEENGHLHSHARVSLIRNELASLTGNHSHAVILNQLLYWTQRTKDFHLMLEEEKKESGAKNDSPRYGWIYKTANDLVAETMLSIDRTTIRRYLHCLIAKEWIQTRGNPQSRWDKTTQYRVNVKKIQKDLVALGHKLSELSFWGLEDALLRRDQNSNVHYTHSNWEFLAKTAEMPNGQNALSNEQTGLSEGQTPAKMTEMLNGQNALSKEYIAHSNGHNAHSNEQNALPKVQNARSNTETTTKIITEITNREHTQKTRACDAFDEILKIWKLHVGQEVQLTEERKRQLQSLLAHHFQDDLFQWERFCERVKSSPFLMGEGARRWRVTFDWILSEGNLLKVLEGNFDRPEAARFRHQEPPYTGNFTPNNRSDELASILTSIEDPIWKSWCTLLLGMNPETVGFLMNRGVPVKAALLLSDIKQITKARFKEFDGRLVWIECATHHVQNRIEDLRLKFLSVVQATYPNARNIRTHLNPHSFQQSTPFEGDMNDVE